MSIEPRARRRGARYDAEAVSCASFRLLPLSPSAPAPAPRAASTARRLPIARTPDLAQALVHLKERGYFVFGADAGEGSTSLWDADFARPLAMALGSKGEGLRPSVAERCDRLVTIPMPAPAESLNASVAAGVMLFEAVRARSADRKQAV